MNRYIIIAIVVVILAGLAVVGSLLFLTPTSPAPVTQQTVTPQPISSTVSVPVGRTKEAARAAFQQAIDKHNIDNTKLYETSISGDYALQVWAGDVMGGEALLKYDATQGRWNIVISSGGTWSVEALVSLGGVSTSTAEALLAGVPR